MKMAVDHPADIHDPDNELSLGDKVELAAGKQPDTLNKDKVDNADTEPQE
jgi:hypothetical protein